MKFLNLYYEFMNSSSGSSLFKYKKMVEPLMRTVEIDGLDSLKMKAIYDELQELQYDDGYAISNVEFKKLISPYKASKTNMRKVFNGSHTSLYNATEQRQMPIKSAVKFCEDNNLELEKYFEVTHIYKYYSIETKQSVKNCIVRTFDYAVSQGYIDVNIAKMPYHFTDSYLVPNTKITSEELEEFVEALLNYRNEKGMLIVILYILSYFDTDFIVNLKVKNVDFNANRIKCNNVEVNMTSFFAKMLRYQIVDFVPEDYVFGTDGVPLRGSSIRTYIYKIRYNDKITVSSLKLYRQAVVKILNKQMQKKMVSFSDVQKHGVKDEDYLDFIKFLEYKENQK